MTIESAHFTITFFCWGVKLDIAHTADPIEGEICPECQEIGDEEVADGDFEYETGVWEKCPMCHGEEKNEMGQPCAWCADSGNPGFVQHAEHGADDE